LAIDITKYIGYNSFVLKEENEIKHMKIKKMDLWCILAPVIMLIICIITKTGWIQIVASVTGVIYVSLIAKENKYGYLFSIINVIFYAILTWQKGLNGTAIFNLAYSLPVLIYGYIFWNKNQGKDNGKIKRMSWDSKIKLYICLLMLIFVYYLFSHFIFKMENALIDGIVVCFSFVGNLLMARKYIDQWFIWIAMNCVNLFFWGASSITDSNSICLVFMWIIYLINNIIGFIAWNKNMRKC